jgi:transcription elongation factor GreA
MNEENEHLTREKYEELRKELQELKSVRRREVAEGLEYAKSLGDLSENAEYHEARETQARLEDRIAKLEAVLKSAVVIEPRQGGKINVGSVVTLEKHAGGAVSTHKYKMVGSEEADVAQGKISIYSPLGAGMVEKSEGEKFSVNTPKGKIDYQIIKVE